MEQSSVNGEDVSRRLRPSTARWFAHPFAAAFGLATVVLVSASFAQGVETMVVGGQILQVGMSRAEALAKLSACCQLIGANDSFFVHSKGGDLLGGVWFSEGRVSRVRRERAYSSALETSRLALALFRAVSERLPSGSSTAVVEAVATEMSNGTDRAVTIRFPNGRSLTLSVGGPDGFPSAARISEDLFER